MIQAVLPPFRKPMSAPTPSAQVPEYAQLADRLAASPLSPTAAEAHGMLCGLICAGSASAAAVWIRELFPEAGRDGPPDAMTRSALQAVAERTRSEIEGPRLGFTPLLPEEGRSLRERAIGLYDWARGLFYGLGVAGLRREDLSEEGREAFADLADITRMDLDALEEGEENEAALAELQEFVWVAAMLIFEERGRSSGGVRVEG
jgi:uncharacterized protein YgfB (UPF0149 family)